jgi:hypothetical protein
MDIKDLPKKTTESGQVLVEIEKNIWIDYETQKIKKDESITQPVTPPFQTKET